MTNIPYLYNQMKPFKFLTNKHKVGERFSRWVEINIHGYGFSVQTTRPDILIDEEVGYIRRNFTPLSDDHVNRNNLLLLLRSRFLHAIDVISQEEFERNGGYIAGNRYRL